MVRPSGFFVKTYPFAKMSNVIIEMFRLRFENICVAKDKTGKPLTLINVNAAKIIRKIRFIVAHCNIKPLLLE